MTTVSSSPANFALRCSYNAVAPHRTMTMRPPGLPGMSSGRPPSAACVPWLGTMSRTTSPPWWAAVAVTVLIAWRRVALKTPPGAGGDGRADATVLALGERRQDPKGRERSRPFRFSVRRSMHPYPAVGVDEALAALAVAADRLIGQDRQDADRTDHLGALGVFHPAIDAEHDVLAGLDLHATDGAAREVGGHRFAPSPSFPVAAAQKPVQATWKRRITPPGRSSSCSISVVVIGLSQPSHGRPLPYPAQSLSGLPDGNSRRMTLSAMRRCGMASTRIHGRA